VHIAIPVCWSHRFVWSIPFFPVEITFPDLGFPDLDPYRFSTLRISDLRIWTFADLALYGFGLTDLGVTDLDLRICPGISLTDSAAHATAAGPFSHRAAP